MKRPLALLALLLLTARLSAGQNELTLDHLFDGSFSPETVGSVNWMQDGEYFTTLVRLQDNGITELRKNSITDGSHEVILSSEELVPEGWSNPITLDDYSFSQDERRILIETGIERIWRRSTRSHFYIFDLDSRQLTKLSAGDVKQSYATFSPQGNQVAFFRENNLFLADLERGTETQITADGQINEIINGAADWVYEEEFYLSRAFFWSPDGQRIAFYRFDESGVLEYVMQRWGNDYPEEVRFKYPKAGYSNSIVTIGVYDLKTGVTAWMDTGEETDIYIPRINWTQDPQTLSIRRLNRLQNRQDLMLANANTGHTRIIKTETNDAWINVNDDLTFLDDGEQFIYLSGEDGYNHIYLYDMDGNLISQVTSGAWEVDHYYGFDEETETFYYLSTEDSPLERHVYRINADGSGKQRLSPMPGWNYINMAPDFSYYLNYVSSDHNPLTVTLHNGRGEQLQVLEDNARLREHISTFNMPVKEYTTITVADTVELNGYWLKPQDFDETKKYPVMMYVYGGPGSQAVQNSYDGNDRGLWHRLLATRGYLVFCVDNRGTGGRGQAFSRQVYKRLGEYETEDQAEAARQLAALPYVDERRIGIWGWSYGGYVSTLSLAYGADIFSMAIAVAPVTDWRYYDTIYTERYMQTPAMNQSGYNNYAPVKAASKIQGNYLLVHGTGDDNVHFQHTVEMTDALISAGVHFETLFYPNRDHSIAGGYARRHLYENMHEFVKHNL